jgi:membrane-associated phospholipid phosphatase
VNRQGPTARTALQGALACFIALALVGLAAAFVPEVRSVDAAATAGWDAAGDTTFGALTRRMAHLCDAEPYCVLGVALIGIALLRGRIARAGAVAVLLVATGLTTQLLKSSLGSPRGGQILGLELGSWPSGHATAAMTLALCAVLVAPRAWRGLVALGGAGFALAVGLGVLVMEWHLPTDVAGGYLVAMGWTLLAVAALRRVEGPAGATAPGASERWGWITVAAVVGIAAASVHVGSIASFAFDYTWATAIAALLLVLAVALAASLAATLRR